MNAFLEIVLITVMALFALVVAFLFVWAVGDEQATRDAYFYDWEKSHPDASGFERKEAINHIYAGVYSGGWSPK